MERTEKGSASADVCVTRISPCRCGKGIIHKMLDKWQEV